MTKETETKTEAPAEESTALATVGESASLVKLAELIGDLPSFTEDPTPRMVEFILNSDTPGDWEHLFNAANVKENTGKQVRINAVRAAESDFQGRIPFYLICDVTWLKTGESGVMTCSSVVGMAQLINLHKRDALPADLEIVAKKKPTKKGFTPIHFRYLDKPVTAIEA